MKIEVDIPIPEESVDESAKERLRRDALEAAVLRLFDERRISSAEAAHDLGLTRIQFMGPWSRPCEAGGVTCLTVTLGKQRYRQPQQSNSVILWMYSRGRSA